ncbi:nucleoside deaminase [Pseudomonadota bacterium]
MRSSTQRVVLNYIYTFFLALILAYSPASLARQAAQLSSTGVVPSAAQIERDEIYGLLAYAVVRKDWQTDQTEPRRGHNIGSVLVDPDGNVVFWARNANAITKNGSQHGEVRLIRNYLENHEGSYLKGYTVYTSLEPCAMCSGMMTLTQVTRTVYGQTDLDYGKALERLQLDSHSFTQPNGFEPYPRPVISDVLDSDIRRRIDTAYAAYQQSGGKGLTTWLRSDEAKGLYDSAFKAFNTYKVKHRENDAVLRKARDYYKKVVSADYVPLPQ